DRAAKVFRQAIDTKVAPRFNADFYYYLAAALEFAEHTDEAIDAARQAATLKKDSPRYVARYPWVLYHGKRYEQADREYRELLAALDKDHGQPDARETAREARLVLSNIALKLGDMPQAEEWLEQVLDEFPEDIGAMNDLGYLWCDQGKHLQRSLRMVQQAVAAEPDNAAYRDSLGWAHFRLGEYDLAVQELEGAAERLKETPDGVIMDHLGDAYTAAGRKQDAAQAYERAIELFTAEDDQENIAKTKAKMERKRP
ncbi:MAG: tetratricopeptide repeat protein, partial [Planctomycetales bacterium]|nr:tetratricopeptide repeat protein [Planctomycetales bacterium]